MTKVFVLGGHQSDFSDNWARQHLDVLDVFKTTLNTGLQKTALDYTDIQTGHVGNFVGDLFTGQGMMGGFFAMVDPQLSGIPASRHEAACASGSVALLAAMADIEAGRYDMACVLGIEQMKNVAATEAARFLGAATWVGHECVDVKYPWPHLFGLLGSEYDKRYGLKYEHLAAIDAINFANAKNNPNAQTRNWTLTDESFGCNEQHNPVIDGFIRKHDCSQVTDGAAVIFLASEQKAQDYARKRNLDINDLPYISGWGHRCAPISYAQKIQQSTGEDYIFPHVRGTITDAFSRAGIADVSSIDVIETHDCFSTTEYMAIDHFGITPPGQSWQAIEQGRISMTGDIPINPSGGLIGCGHPVGATGVRMLLDASKQVCNQAGDYQVNGARTAQTLNLGGSGTTAVSFIVSQVS